MVVELVPASRRNVAITRLARLANRGPKTTLGFWAVVAIVVAALLDIRRLRAHELCDLNVEDADIVLERLNVRDAKTPKGVRFVYTTPKLKGVLADYLTPSSTTPAKCVTRVGILRCRIASRRTPCAAPTALCGSRPSRRRRSRG